MFAAMLKNYETEHGGASAEGDKLWDSRDDPLPSGPAATSEETNKLIREFRRSNPDGDLYAFAASLRDKTVVASLLPTKPQKVPRRGADLSLKASPGTPAQGRGRGRPPRQAKQAAKRGRKKRNKYYSDDSEEEIEFTESSEEEEDLDLESGDSDEEENGKEGRDDGEEEIPEEEVKPAHNFTFRERKRRLIVNENSDEEELGSTEEAGSSANAEIAASDDGEIVPVSGEANGEGATREKGLKSGGNVFVEVRKVKKKRIITGESDQEDEDEEMDIGDDAISIASSASFRRPRNDSDSSSEGEGKESETVRVLMEQCESISENLRSVLQSGALEQTGALLDEASAQQLIGNAALELKPYQIAGVNWLSVLHRQNLNAVLADEMGLGKTVQAIAFLRLLFKRDNVRGPHLIVAPASTVENWCRELQTWLPELRSVAYTGTQKERAEMRRDYKRGGDETPDIWVTTYTYFERESSKDDRKFFFSMPFRVCIYDEAHAIKNTDAQRYQMLFFIQSKRKILLSGTPVQNNLDELFALLSFCLPRIFDRNKSKLRRKVFGVDSDPGKVRHILAPFILRRLKAHVLSQLSAKTEEVIRLKMLPEQEAAYNRVLDEFGRLRAEREAEVLENAEVAGGQKPANKKPAAGGKRAPGAATMATSESVFTELRKIANHALMVKRRFGADGRPMNVVVQQLLDTQYFGAKASLKKVEKELERLSDWDLNRICHELDRRLGHMILPAEDLYDVSCKAAKLREILPDLLKAGHRILLFSQWKIMLDILEEVLITLGVEYMRLDGSTAVDQRQSMVDSFNAGVGSVFLLSTRAGGVGINLTSADTVVLHDLDFNPTIDAQAMDRCHRIGQKKDVRVIKLICEGTVDEAIYKIQQRKIGLNQAVLGDGTRRVGLGSANEQGDGGGALLPALEIFEMNAQPNPSRGGSEGEVDEAEQKALMDEALQAALSARGFSSPAKSSAPAVQALD